MAVITAYLAYNQNNWDLNKYYSDFKEHVIDEDIHAPNEAYSYFTNSDIALVLIGNGFDYSPNHHMVRGTVNGIREAFWNAGNESWDDIYLMTGASTVSSREVYNAGQTRSRTDDKAILKKLLSGDDRFNLSDEDDNARGFHGNDRMYGKAGEDKLYGGNGNDKIYGGVGDDYVKGGHGNDRVAGGQGDDQVRGGAGNDLLFGNRGNDKLYGSAGNDTVVGGYGNDYMRGGKGADTFVFNNGDGRDRIGDFSTSEDRIDLSGVSDIRSFRDLMDNHAVANGNNVEISYGEGSVIVLYNVSLDDLSSSNFIF